MRYFGEIRTMQDYLEGLAQDEDVPLLDGLTLDESAEQAVDVVLRRVMVALTPDERLVLLGEAGLGETELGEAGLSEAGLAEARLRDTTFGSES
jgi:2-phosphoglycerate kinase